jgi:hypothetical protein
VYYVRSQQGAYLLPQRVAHFADFLSRFQAATGIDTRSIGRISPAWTYQLLALLCGLMLAGETAAAWALATGRWDFPPGLGG